MKTIYLKICYDGEHNFIFCINMHKLKSENQETWDVSYSVKV